MRILFIVSSLCCLLLSCKNKYQVNEDYVYSSQGFKEGFTIQLLKVETFDERGVPKNFQFDTLRTDFNSSFETSGKTKFWLNKDNGGGYWTLQLKGEYPTIPINLENGRWYLLWSNAFTSGFLETNRHSFFIHKDNSGRFFAFERVRKTNF